MTTEAKTGSLAGARTFGRAATSGWGIARVVVRGGRGALGRPVVVVASRAGVRAGLALDIAVAVARRAGQTAMRAAEEGSQRKKPRTPAA